MKIYPEDLNKQLKKQLLPIYHISGDEPLLIQEAVDSIRATAKKNDFTERETLTVQTGFDWEQLLACSKTLSLFASKKVIELRVGQSKISKAASDILQEYAKDPSAETILIITSSKLDAATKRAKWYTAIDKVGVTIQVWPVDEKYFPTWVSKRLSSAKLPTDRRLVELISYRASGNLLAAAQEIEKCQLLYDGNNVETLITSISDSARYTVFELVDACLLGEASKAIRILQRLKAEGIEPNIVLWSVTRDIRLCANIRAQLAKGISADEIMKNLKIWTKRQSILRQYIRRNNMEMINTHLQQASKLDRLLKGFGDGDAWIEIEKIVMTMCGVTQTKTLS